MKVNFSLYNCLVLAHLQTVILLAFCPIPSRPRPERYPIMVEHTHAWPCLHKKTAQCIQKVQNACMRFCYRIPNRSHISLVLVRHKMLIMKNILTQKYACFVQSLFRFSGPLYLLKTWKSWITLCLRNLSLQLHNILLLAPRVTSNTCFQNALYLSVAIFRKGFLRLANVTG